MRAWALSLVPARTCFSWVVPQVPFSSHMLWSKLGLNGHLCLRIDTVCVRMHSLVCVCLHEVYVCVCVPVCVHVSGVCVCMCAYVSDGVGACVCTQE